MTPEQIRSLYNARYVAEYDAKFLESKANQPDTEFELATLRDLLQPQSRWLDVACGTGYFLSRFPQVERAGLDMSPAMLEMAAARNLGVSFQCRSYLEPIPEWRDQWSLVSCMWYAYAYVSSMMDFERLVGNLSTWTAPGGICFVPLCDPQQLTGAPIPYDVPDSPVWTGKINVTSVTWTYIEEGGDRHEHLMTPMIPHILALFGRYFEDLRVIRYPTSPRTALVARRKREPKSSV